MLILIVDLTKIITLTLKNRQESHNIWIRMAEPRKNIMSVR